MPQELLDFVVVADKREGDGAPAPIEQHAQGEVRAELPEIAAELFNAKTRGDLTHIHGQHERIDLPLHGHFLAWMKTLQAVLETAGEPELKHGGGYG